MLGLAWKQKIETSQDESFYQPSLFLSFLLKGKGQWLVRKIDSSKAGFHLLFFSASPASLIFLGTIFFLSPFSFLPLLGTAEMNKQRERKGERKKRFCSERARPACQWISSLHRWYVGNPLTCPY